MRRVFISLIALAVICLIVFGVNMISNERMKNKFAEGTYEVNKLSVLGFTEPYISYYNRGCVYYQEEKYDLAIKEFETALSKKPKGDHDCMTRINLALSMVKSFKEEDITADNLQNIIDLLNRARDILTENGCANPDDDNGHNEDAQTLKNEIDEFLKKLENMQQSESQSESSTSEDPSESESENESESESESSTSENESLAQQLQQLQNQGQSERNNEMGFYENRNQGYNFGGVSW